jgi:hypothetical protein
MDTITASVGDIRNGPAIPGLPGLGASAVVGVPFTDLTPLRTQVPVHDDPVASLTAPAPDRAVTAHVLATLAGYAYGDALTVSTMATRLGLERNRVRTVDETVDAMFIRSTAHVVQSACGRVVVLAYRGTEPTNLVSWFTDGDADPEIQGADDTAADPLLAHVHAGFYRNVRATRFHVATVLLEALEGRAIAGEGTVAHRAEALYFTGHSLGGAMALIHAVLLARDAEKGFWRARRLRDILRGVHTFGAPMAGDRRFAALCREAGVADLVQRYVYRNDPVPALPPSFVGRYEHVGTEHRLGSGWFPPALLGPQAALLPLLLSPVAFAARQIGVLRDVPFTYSLGAHAPQNYVAALAPDGTTEFGRPAGSRPPRTRT